MAIDYTKGLDWGLIIAIFILIPLFCIKLSQSAFPIPRCSHADLEKNNVAHCEINRRLNMDSQYLISLIIGAAFIIIGYVLFYTKLASRSACLALVYGGLGSLVYAIYLNYNRLENEAQMSVIGLALIIMIFLPGFTNQVLIV